VIAAPKFPLGRIYTTPGVLATVGQAAVLPLIRRHVTGDWGEMDAEDRAANEHALATGERIFSAYTVGEGDDTVVVWVITEADRSATTVLLPEEY